MPGNMSSGLNARCSVKTVCGGRWGAPGHQHHTDRQVIGVAKALEEVFQGYTDLKRPVLDIAKLENAA